MSGAENGRSGIDAGAMMQKASTEAEPAGQPSDVAQRPDYETLQADVEAWRADWIGYVRGEYGDDAAEEAAQYLDERPWLCLKWFVDDRTPKEQRESPTPFL
ncbi:hypothetical protein HF263_30260 [Rhizobium leguminosarum]|uniref:hypothetical protein n=1 Tax=Rhizobium leguminosarum TaxID=384 RepID=UPI001C91AD75|nr:hypothetical protein [Rhizobium leguminosarum]MBY3060292.1 hypothetical protein [Rhizobium leguminosarum]